MIVLHPNRWLLLLVLGALGLSAPAQAGEAPGAPLDLTLKSLSFAQASQPASAAAASQPASAVALPVVTAPAPAPEPAPAGWWGRYTKFWDKELERIIAMDLWGVTTQLPKGYLTVKYKFNYREAAGRFDGQGRRIPVLPVIGFGDETQGKPCLDQESYADCLLAFDAGATGYGGSHEIQLSYGLTGRLDLYVQIPMQYHHVRFKPHVLTLDRDFATAAGISFTPQNGNAVPDELTDYTFMELIKRLGRPAPLERADKSLALGDINTGFSWNFLRTKWISTALTYRVFLPTAYVADPDNSIAFFTGPDIDAGNGAWAMGVGLGHDFRLPRFIHKNIDITFSWEWNFSYSFATERDYPSVCATPYDRLNPDACRGFRPPDQAMQQLFDPQGLYFPDMSQMRADSSTYTYRPGFAQDMMMGLNLGLFGIGLGAGIGQSWSQKPEFEGDPNFIAMVNNLEIVAPVRATIARFALQIPLVPLYIPAALTAEYEYNITGANFMYFKNNFFVTVQGFIPDEYLYRRH